MHTLDLLSQVLFVGLMAMLLFVLYKRFVRMLSRGRIQGDYASVVQCEWKGGEGLRVVIESDAAAECQVTWSGGDATLACPAGRHEAQIQMEALPEEVTFTFGNQVVRRKLA